MFFIVLLFDLDDKLQKPESTDEVPDILLKDYELQEPYTEIPAAFTFDNEAFDYVLHDIKDDSGDGHKYENHDTITDDEKAPGWLEKIL